MDETTQIQKQLALQNELFQKNIDLREKELEKQSELTESNLLRVQAELAAKEAVELARVASENQRRSFEVMIAKIDTLLEYLTAGHLEKEFADMKHSLNVQTSAIEGIALVVFGRNDGMTRDEMLSLLKSALTRPDQVQKIAGIKVDEMNAGRDAHIITGRE